MMPAFATSSSVDTALLFLVFGLGALWAGSVIAERCFTASQRSHAAETAKAIFGVAALGSGLLTLVAMALGY